MQNSGNGQNLNKNPDKNDILMNEIFSGCDIMML